MQGVDGGPAAGTVAAFPGVDAFGVGAGAAGLDFGGESGEAEEQAGALDGAPPPAGAGGHAGDGGPAAAAGVVVGGGGLGGGVGQDGGQGYPATAGGHESGAQQQVAALVDPGDVGNPAFS